jgi:hypothetical protein
MDSVFSTAPPQPRAKRIPLTKIDGRRDFILFCLSMERSSLIHANPPRPLTLLPEPWAGGPNVYDSSTNPLKTRRSGLERAAVELSSNDATELSIDRDTR